MFALDFYLGNSNRQKNRLMNCVEFVKTLTAAAYSGDDAFHNLSS